MYIYTYIDFSVKFLTWSVKVPAPLAALGELNKYCAIPRVLFPFIFFSDSKEIFRTWSLAHYMQ